MVEIAKNEHGEEYTARMYWWALELWVNALRSDEYQQITGRLAGPLPGDKSGAVAYCCLGVKCEVARRNGLELAVTTEEDGGDLRYDGCGGALPLSVSSWGGVRNAETDVLAGDPYLGRRRASSWNDSYGKTFPEIADLAVRYVQPVDDPQRPMPAGWKLV